MATDIKILKIVKNSKMNRFQWKFLVTMATVAILIFFNPRKADTHYGGYFYKVS
jgi:hypothetical protein